MQRYASVTCWSRMLVAVGMATLHGVVIAERYACPPSSDVRRGRRAWPGRAAPIGPRGCEAEPTCVGEASLGTLSEAWVLRDDMYMSRNR